MLDETRKTLEMLPSRQPQMLRAEASMPPDFDCRCWDDPQLEQCGMHPDAEFYDRSHLRPGELPERWLTTEQGFVLAAALGGLCWFAVYHWAPQIVLFLRRFAGTAWRM